jgi:UDP-glucose 4-epimerase
MRILVTGGAGYIGSHTCVALLEAGHDVAILDNLSNSCIEVINRIKLISKRPPAFFNVDVRVRAAVESVFDSFHPEAVIHFAGLKAVGESVQNPLRYYEWNVSGSVVLFQVMEKKKVKKLVFSSSANVYGVAIGVPIRESALIAPTNPYGQSKAMIEQILADLVAADTEWRIACLRYFNPMGAHESGLIGEDPNGVPSNLPPYISQVAVGKLDELQIFGGDYSTPDGTGVRDYIHVKDLAHGHLAALDYLAKERGLLTVNLGTGRGYSVLELVNAFENACGKPVPYCIVERRSGDVAQSFADPSEAVRLLGWKARFSLEDMCRDAWRWQSMNPQGYGLMPASRK